MRFETIKDAVAGIAVMGAVVTGSVPEKIPVIGNLAISQAEACISSTLKFDMNGKDFSISLMEDNKPQTVDGETFVLKGVDYKNKISTVLVKQKDGSFKEFKINLNPSIYRGGCESTGKISGPVAKKDNTIEANISMPTVTESRIEIKNKEGLVVLKGMKLNYVNPIAATNVRTLENIHSEIDIFVEQAVLDMYDFGLKTERFLDGTKISFVNQDGKSVSLNLNGSKTPNRAVVIEKVQDGLVNGARIFFKSEETSKAQWESITLTQINGTAKYYFLRDAKGLEPKRFTEFNGK
jgi:hypothetical protein